LIVAIGRTVIADAALVSFVVSSDVRHAGRPTHCPDPATACSVLPCARRFDLAICPHPTHAVFFDVTT
jgi:hypothetical protein